MPSHATAKDGDISLVYFFSLDCPHCVRATPIVTELSRDYPVTGLFYGEKKPEDAAFPVRKGTKKEREQYKVMGVPVLVALMADKYRTSFVGDKAIKDSLLILSGLKKGALTTSEAVGTPPANEVLVVGWLQSRGAYFGEKTVFILTDRQTSIKVNPWLPLEAVKSRFRKARPRVMSDVLNKPVLLRGRLVKTDDEPFFEVKEEASFE